MKTHHGQKLRFEENWSQLVKGQECHCGLREGRTKYIQLFKSRIMNGVIGHGMVAGTEQGRNVRCVASSSESAALSV